MIWPHLFLGVMLYSLVDGFLGLVHSSPLILLSRDFFVLTLYFFYTMEMRSSGHMRELSESLGNWFVGLLSVYIVNGLLQIFNPNSFGLLTGILGFKIMFLNLGLLAISFFYVNSREDIIRFFKALVLVSILVNAFGIYQHMMGPAWLVSTFGPGIQRLFTSKEEIMLTDFFRVPGTFASGGIYATYLVANLAFVFILLADAFNQRDRLLWSFCGILNVFALIVTGTRGAVLYIVAGIIIYAVLSRNIKRTAVAFIFFGVIFFAGLRWFGDSATDRYATLRNVEMIKDRSYRAAAGLFSKYLNRYPLGKGLGVASQQIRHLPGLQGKKWELVENYPTKLLVETGISGVIIFHLIIVVIILRWFEWLRYLRERDRNMMMPLAVFSILVLCIAQNGIESSPTSLFLWISIGFGAKMGCLARNEIEATRYMAEDRAGA